MKALFTTKKIINVTLIFFLIINVTLAFGEEQQGTFKPLGGEPPRPIKVDPQDLTKIQKTNDFEKDASTEINVKNADIAAIVKVFSNKTKRNYILDENVRGKVSIYLPGKVTSEEALQILESVLALKGFTSVPVSKNLWKIIPAKDAKGATIPTKFMTGQDSTAAVVTRLINLKYVSAEDMQQIISQMISPNGTVNAYTGTNSLIIIDSEDNIVRLAKIIESLDVPFTNQEMTIIPITYAEAIDIAEKLNEILTDENNKSANANMNNIPGNLPPRFFNNQNRGQFQNASQQNQANINGKTISSRAKEPKIIADERTNSIILLADEETSSKIRALIDQLDSPVDLSGNRFYVYRCQHANAEDLAEVLSGLSSENKSSTSSTDSSENSTRRNRTQERLASQTRSLGTSRLSTKTNDGVQSASFGEDVSITADAATNSLIISASKTDYQKILNLLSELDVKRRQVLVEAMLLEVGLTDTTTTGMEWLTSTGGKDGGIFASNTTGSLQNLFSHPDKLSGFTMAAASSGSLTLGDVTLPTQTILLEAAANNSNVNVLSAPNLLTADNEEAEIVVGQNVPFLASTSTSTDNLNNTFNQIDRQDVGITLRLTPRISEGDFVTLNVFTEVSSVVTATANSTLGPTTTVRTSETTVIAKDNQMIVIGGLISDNTSQSEDGVPFLKDIPLLGHAFKKSTNAFDKTNLLIFITPRVIRDQYDARDNTIEEKNKLEDVIAYNDIEPNRKEQLNNKKIDNIAMSEEFKGTPPSMITTANDTDKNLPSSTGEVLKLKASPRIGKQKPFSKEAPKASLNLNKISNNLNISNKKFIVMRLLSKDKDSMFKTSNRLFGITIPQDVNRFAKNFFMPGEYYLYNFNGKEIKVFSEGIFKTKEDAEYIYKELKQASWNGLTPHDIMNLGSAPWKKVNN